MGSCNTGRIQRWDRSSSSKGPVSHRRDRAAETRALDDSPSTQCRGLGLPWSWLRQPTAGGVWGFGLIHVCPSVLRPHLLASALASHHEEHPPNSPPWKTLHQKLRDLELLFPTRISNTSSAYSQDAFLPHNHPTPSPTPSSSGPLAQFLSLLPAYSGSSR